MELKEKIKLIPHKPGVYLMLNQDNKVIYVGKASDLRNRVSSYFNNSAKDIKTNVLVKKINNIDFIVTENEVEALILESNLIKKYLPRYNIMLKDDKRYPFLEITVTEDYPRVLIVRERKDNGSIYFGPYTNVKEMRTTLKLLQRVFPFRKCNKKLVIENKNSPFFKPVGKVCLNFQIGQCLAPCQGNIAPEEYKSIIEQVILFLNGESEKLINDLRIDMNRASEKLEFEKAAAIRDKINSLESVLNKQKIIMTDFNSMDVLAVSNKEEIFNITILFVRDGKLLGKDNFIINNTISNNSDYVLTEFVKRYYSKAIYVPSEIIVSADIYDVENVVGFLSKNKKKVNIRGPKTDTEIELINMAAENSAIELSNYLIDLKMRDNMKGVEMLRKILNLKRLPNIIEGFDISNIQGSNPVASMVRFENGIPAKSEYRKFKIKTVKGINDFKMIEEVVFRRYRRILTEGKKLPDLILIDGGKGQLNAAITALEKLEIKNVPIISIAKKEELIFKPNTDEPIKLSRRSPALKLLQNIRDESHRFAVAFHKQLRRKRILSSNLDSIKGVGEKLKEELFKRFGSMENIRKADINELIKIKGITEKIAQDIKNAY